MKVLLDENIDTRLKKLIKGHNVFTVRDKGWFGKRNGQLMQLLVAEKFDALITADKNLGYQQNFSLYPIPVLVLNAPGIDYASLALLVPEILQRLQSPLSPGIVQIGK